MVSEAMVTNKKVKMKVPFNKADLKQMLCTRISIPSLGPRDRSEFYK